MPAEIELDLARADFDGVARAAQQIVGEIVRAGLLDHGSALRDRPVAPAVLVVVASASVVVVRECKGSRCDGQEGRRHDDELVH